MASEVAVALLAHLAHLPHVRPVNHAHGQVGDARRAGLEAVARLDHRLDLVGRLNILVALHHNVHRRHVRRAVGNLELLLALLVQAVVHRLDALLGDLARDVARDGLCGVLECVLVAHAVGSVAADEALMPAPLTSLPCSYSLRTDGPMPLGATSTTLMSLRKSVPSDCITPSRKPCDRPSVAPGFIASMISG